MNHGNSLEYYRAALHREFGIAGITGPKRDALCGQIIDRLCRMSWMERQNLSSEFLDIKEASRRIARREQTTPDAILAKFENHIDELFTFCEEIAPTGSVKSLYTRVIYGTRPRGKMGDTASAHHDLLNMNPMWRERIAASTPDDTPVAKEETPTFEKTCTPSSAHLELLYSNPAWREVIDARARTAQPDKPAPADQKKRAGAEAPRPL